jgi:isoquinoline 1-oxidoreductase beta subunit
VNALTFEKDGRFESHTGNQWQSVILPVLAQAFGLPQERIVMRTYPIGGESGAGSTATTRSPPRPSA